MMEKLINKNKNQNGEETSTGAVHIVKLSAYTSPIVEEKFNKEWVEYRVKNYAEYDHPNGFYQYLIDRARGSTTNGAIITGFKRFIYGKGLMATDAVSNVGQFAAMKGIIKDKDLKKAIGDRKRLMMAAFAVTYTAKKVTSITYFPMRTLLPEKKNQDGEIEAWYYHPDWKTRVLRDTIKRIPAFGFGNRKESEIYIIRDEGGDSDYFGEDEGYTGALAYAVLEEEIGDYQINQAQNSFTPTTIINYNNGVPAEELRKEITKDTISAVTGATGKPVVVSFNEGVESAVSVEKISLDNAPEHYAYLSEECEQKLLTGHLAPSELLGFNKDSQGFSNNAEELINKFRAFGNYQVQPIQQEFIDALNEILMINDIVLNLYFIPIDPLEFVDTEGMDEETKEEETGQTTQETQLAGFDPNQPRGKGGKWGTKDNNLLNEVDRYGQSIREKVSRWTDSALEQTGIGRVFDVRNEASIDNIDKAIEGIKHNIERRKGFDFNNDIPVLKLVVKELQFLKEGKINATQLSEEVELSDDEGEKILEFLKGEDVSEDWDLVETRQYNELNDSHDDWANRCIRGNLTLLARIIKSKPSGKSKLDKSFYKVRFSYQKGDSPIEEKADSISRPFCVAMMARTDKGVVYRREDIIQASFQGVNKSHGHNGRNYNLLRYKGGVWCTHIFSEELYRLKKKTDGTFREDKALSSSDIVKTIPKRFKPKGAQYEDAKTPPRDMPDHGHHPDYRTEDK